MTLVERSRQIAATIYAARRTDTAARTLPEYPPRSTTTYQGPELGGRRTTGDTLAKPP
jgi:hypothetical protein